MSAARLCLSSFATVAKKDVRDGEREDERGGEREEIRSADGNPTVNRDLEVSGRDIMGEMLSCPFRFFTEATTALACQAVSSASKHGMPHRSNTSLLSCHFLFNLRRKSSLATACARSRWHDSSVS